MNRDLLPLLGLALAGVALAGEGAPTKEPEPEPEPENDPNTGIAPDGTERPLGLHGVPGADLQTTGTLPDYQSAPTSTGRGLSSAENCDGHVQGLDDTEEPGVLIATNDMGYGVVGWKDKPAWERQQFLLLDPTGTDDENPNHHGWPTFVQAASETAPGLWTKGTQVLYQLGSATNRPVLLRAARNGVYEDPRNTLARWGWDPLSLVRASRRAAFQNLLWCKSRLGAPLGVGGGLPLADSVYPDQIAGVWMFLAPFVEAHDLRELAGTPGNLINVVTTHRRWKGLWKRAWLGWAELARKGKTTTRNTGRLPTKAQIDAGLDELGVERRDPSSIDWTEIPDSYLVDVAPLPASEVLVQHEREKQAAQATATAGSIQGTFATMVSTPYELWAAAGDHAERKERDRRLAEQKAKEDAEKESAASKHGSALPSLANTFVQGSIGRFGV